MKIGKIGIRRRVSINNEVNEPILRIDRMGFRFILKDAILYLSLGLLAAIFGGLLAQLVLPPLAVVGIGLLICIIAILLGFKSEKQLKPFYILFMGKSYKTWSEGKEANAKKGQMRNIHIQFSQYQSIENTKTATIIRNKSGEHLYKGTNFLNEDVALIREYFKKHKVRRIS